MNAELGMTSSLPYMNTIIWNNAAFDYILAIAIFAVALVVLRIVKTIIIKYFKKLAKKTKNDVDDMIVEAVERVFVKPFYAIVSAYIALKYLTLPANIDQYAYYFMILVGTYYGVKFLSTFVDYGTRKFIEREEKREKKKIDTSAIKLMNTFVKIILAAIAVVLILSNFGFDVTSLVAGLGVGGIAVAFALQNILSDIFASFSIYFDKPFQTGDFIVIGSDAGTVKKIGIQSTRITTLEGEELVVSNKELVSTRVHNYKKLKKRRISFEFGVVYGTKTKKLKKIPDMVKKIINSVDKADVDRVHFTEFGDSALKFSAVYYVNSKDYAVYRGIQQEINLKIKEKFEKEKIEMAFPTQTIFLEK